MAHDEPNSTDRRTFLQAGALATASALSLAPGLKAQDAPAKVVTVPRRPLGKTGVDITMLNQGAVRVQSLDRIFRFAFANGIRTFDTAKVLRLGARLQEVVRAGRPRSARRSSWSPRTHPRTPSQMIEDGRPAAGDPGDRLHRPLLHPRPRRRPQPRRRHQPGEEQGVQGDGRGDPEVGQGQVRRLLVPPQGPRPDHPGGGRGRDRRRDHAPVHPLARQGRPAEQGARRLLEEGDRPDLDEAGRRQALRRPAQGEHPRGRGPPGPDARREEADPLPGPAARDLDRRADQQLLRLDAEHRPDPREHRRRPPLRAAEGRRRSASSATPPWPTARPSAPTATAAARRPRARRPSWAT